MGADNQILIRLAIAKLQGTKPKGWETDARELFESVVSVSYPNTTKEAREAAWRDGLSYMKDHHRDEWDTFVKAMKRPEDLAAIPWSKVVLERGQADGDNFTLRFDVDGMKCVIECTDVQLLDADYILRKLVMYTRKDVECPYLGRKQIEAWRRNVVLPWLKSDAFRHIERQTIGDLVDDLIREYCTNTVAAETGPDVWLQLKRAILDNNVIYVPFSGLQEFVGKRAGNDPSKRMIKNALARLGFNEVKKGKRALRFHTISIKELYGDDIEMDETNDNAYEKDTDIGQAGSGQIHTDRPDGIQPPQSGTDGVLDLIRQEEHSRPETKNGNGTAPPETPF